MRSRREKREKKVKLFTLVRGKHNVKNWFQNDYFVFNKHSLVITNQ
jgi:hypothetical protein